MAGSAPSDDVQRDASCDQERRDHEERDGQERSGRDSGGQADQDSRDERAKKLTDLIDQIDDEIEGEDELAVGDILDAFGTRSFGPLISAPALILLTPLGGVPILPTVVGSCIALVAAQHLAGKDRPWLPSKLVERSVSADKWEKTKEKARPWAKRIDWVLRPRLQMLTNEIMERVIAVVVITLAISMVPLELVPFAVMAPAAGVLMLGLALSARDGVAVILGLIATGVSGFFVWMGLMG